MKVANGMKTRSWRSRAAAVAALLLGLLAAGSVAAATPAAGPPYPDPVTGQRVYDYAGVFSSGAVAQAEQTILAIEQRTGAQVAIYTQVKPESDTLDLANADALALMNQWGVGRKGFDDGLVILFDMQTNLRHGQVSLYAGSGFKAAFLSNSDRQNIFDNDTVALGDVNAAATPEHADQLNRARILNAVVGFGAVILAVVLVCFVFFRWYRYGRDPLYVDDDSVLMPAPPDGLSPAMATLLMDDRTSSRTTSAAMVDLAARGRMQFREAERSKTSIALTGSPEAPGTPEGDLYSAIAEQADAGGVVDSSDMPDLAGSVGKLSSNLEILAVDKGWLTGRPSRVVWKWMALGVVVTLVSIPLFIWTIDLEASGGFLGGGAMVLAGLVICAIAWFMPCRTQLGAMLRAMLAAYRRTLQYTMAQSSSMEEVVARRPVPWIDTPDKAMAWGVAFGLNKEIEGVLDRSLEQQARSGRYGGWYPMWWVPIGGSPGSSSGFGGGMFSPNAIPDLGSMMSAIGSIGASTSHSGGGSFGGGGGGGGGGAGGGF